MSNRRPKSSPEYSYPPVRDVAFDHPAFEVALHQALSETYLHQRNVFNRAFGPLKNDPFPPTEGERQSKNDYLDMVANDVDYHPEEKAEPHEVRVGLEEFTKNFIAQLRDLKDMTGLLNQLEQFIEQEHRTLFYETNDYMTSSIRRDYVLNFMDTLVKELSEVHELDSHGLERIRDLKAMYKMGFDAYDLANEKLCELSGGNHSLLVEAERRLEEANVRAKVAERLRKEAEAAGKEDLAGTSDSAGTEKVKGLQDYAHDVMHDVLIHAFGVDSGHNAPPPLLILLAEQSEHLAQAQVDALNPAVDMRDPRADSKLHATQYGNVLESWSKQFRANRSMQNAYTIHRTLKKQIAVAENLPDADGKAFSALVREAHNAAESHTRSMLPKLVAEQKWMEPTPPSLNRKLVEAIHPSYDTLGNLEGMFNRCIKYPPDAPVARTKAELLDVINASLDSIYDNVLISSAPPAVALAAKEYIASLRQHLGQALHKAGCHDERFLRDLKELEEKADMIHESHRVAGSWLMEETKQGHDTFFHHALVTIGSKSGLDKADLNRLASYAKNLLIKLTEERGVPVELADLPYIPVIWARCADIAHAEVLRNYERRDRDITVARPRSWVERESSLPQITNAESNEMAERVKNRTQEILLRVMDRVIPAEDVDMLSKASLKATKPRARQATKDKAQEITEAVLGSIKLDAHNLHLIMEQLDWFDRRREPSRLH